jgi:hypothetical protein
MEKFCGELLHLKLYKQLNDTTSLKKQQIQTAVNTIRNC